MRIGTAVAVFVLGCNEPDLQTAGFVEGAEGNCVVARAAEFRVTKDDAVALRKHYVPSPTLGAATRWAVDIALAEWREGEKVGALPVAERVHNFRKRFAALQAEARTAGTRVSDMFERMRTEARAWPLLNQAASRQL